MKKTIGIITTLLLTVFGGAFIASIINKKIQNKTSAQNVRKESISATEPQNAIPTPSAPKAVFYTSVGGSSPTNDSATPETRVSTRYTIELGTLSSQAEAETLLLQLKSKGIDGFYTPTRRGGVVLYHVRLGLFAHPDDAEQSLKKIALRTKMTGRVTKLN